MISLRKLLGAVWLYAGKAVVAFLQSLYLGSWSSKVRIGRFLEGNAVRVTVCGWLERGVKAVLECVY